MTRCSTMESLSVADRMAEAMRILRSPVAKDLAGDVTPVGQGAVDMVQGVFDKMATIAVETPDDAMALATMSYDLLKVIAANASGNDTAKASVAVLEQALLRLMGYLETSSGRRPEEFAMIPNEDDRRERARH